MSSTSTRSTTIPNTVWVLPRPSRSKYPGSYPLHFESKLWNFLGKPAKVLQPFGGCSEIGDTVDLNETTGSTWTGDAHDLHWIEDDTYDSVWLDPPYSDEEAEEIYGTPRLRYGTFVAEAVRVCRPGGTVVIYHRLQAPRPEGCILTHRIVILTRTWHSARIAMVYRKQEALF